MTSRGSAATQRRHRKAPGIPGQPWCRLPITNNYLAQAVRALSGVPPPAGSRRACRRDDNADQTNWTIEQWREHVIDGDMASASVTNGSSLAVPWRPGYWITPAPPHGCGRVPTHGKCWRNVAATGGRRGGIVTAHPAALTPRDPGRSGGGRRRRDAATPSGGTPLNRDRPATAPRQLPAG